MDFFSNHINEMLDKICVEQSHVLLGSPRVLEVIIALNEAKYREMTHISRETYYDKFRATVVRRDMNPLVANVYASV